MQANPLISVVVPSYNYANYLPHLFDTLSKQTYPNWECIVVDDESKDQTKELVLGYTEKEPRIKYIFQKNAGPATARKLGVDSSSGDYIQFIDADDYIGFDKFKIEMELFRQNSEVDVVYSSYLLTNSELSTFWKDVKTWQTLSNNAFYDFVKHWEAGLMIPLNSFLYKKECFLKYGSFDSNFRTHEDWDLNLNLSLSGFKYLHHDYSGAYYRIHQQSSSRTNLTNNKRDTLNVLAKYIHSHRTNFSQKFLLINRYADFLTDFTIERVRFNKIDLGVILNTKSNLGLNVYTYSVFPYFFIRKILRKFFKKNN